MARAPTGAMSASRRRIADRDGTPSRPDPAQLLDENHRDTPSPRKDAPASHHLGGLDDQRKSRAWVLDYVRRHPGYFRMLVRDGDSAGSEN